MTSEWARKRGQQRAVGMFLGVLFILSVGVLAGFGITIPTQYILPLIFAMVAVFMVLQFLFGKWRRKETASEEDKRAEREELGNLAEYASQISRVAFERVGC